MATQTLEKRPTAEATPAERTRSGRTYIPAVDIYETADELVLLADMPGVKAQDISVDFEQGELSIAGKVECRRCEGADLLLGEYETGDYFRSFRIGEVIDAGRISAEHKDGVLTLHLPKVEAVKPRKITVKAS